VFRVRFGHPSCQLERTELAEFARVHAAHDRCYAHRIDCRSNTDVLCAIASVEVRVPAVTVWFLHTVCVFLYRRRRHGVLVFICKNRMFAAVRRRR
jgi:hypothetical protein